MTLKGYYLRIQLIQVYNMFNNKLYKEKYYNLDLSNFSFLITGGAGFIGSNIVEYLLRHNAGHIRILDNLSNGYFENIRDFLEHNNVEFVQGDIRDLETCKLAVKGMHYISHQAALGSVPRSIHNPITTNDVNISGFLNMLVAAKEENSIKRMVYAASSSTYGDHKSLPKVEDRIGKPLSPYAVTKLVNELYADVFARAYNLKTIGLRYFNVFGPKQNPNNPYAAVIPLFVNAAKSGTPPKIFGDGEQTRDFTFVENVVQANIRALLTSNEEAINQVYNIAFGERISLNKLWQEICVLKGITIDPVYLPNRPGDILDSLADISKAKKHLGYDPDFSLKAGLAILVEETEG